MGAGVGLVGLTLAKLGANVTLTDKAALLGLLRGNVAKNWLGDRARPGCVMLLHKCFTATKPYAHSGLHCTRM